MFGLFLKTLFRNVLIVTIPFTYILINFAISVLILLHTTCGSSNEKALVFFVSTCIHVANEKN